jgi:hypothetical protein
VYQDLHPKTTLKKLIESLLSSIIPIKPKATKILKKNLRASEAYHILSDEKRKANYDQFGHAAFEGGGGVVKVLADLIHHPFQIFLRTFSVTLAEVVPLEDQAIEEMI